MTQEAALSSPAVPGQEQAPAEASQPQYLTKNDLEAFATELEDRAFRRAQSYTDQGREQIRQRVKAVEEVVDMFRKAGIQVTDEQARSISDRAAIASQLDGGLQPNARQRTDEPQAPSQEDARAVLAQTVNEIAAGLLEEAEVEIDKDSPNYPMIKNNAPTPKAYIASVRAYIKAEQARKEENPSEDHVPAVSRGSQAGNRQLELARQLEALGEKPWENMPEILKIQKELEALLR